MISLSRIDSASVKLGNSFVVSNSRKISSQYLKNEQQEENNKSSQEDIQMANAIIEQAKQQAQQIIQDAEAQAQDVMKKAQDSINKSVEEIKIKEQEVFNEAKKTGFEAGGKEIYSTLTDQLNFVDLFVNSTNKIKKEIICSSEKEIVELSIVIAEKIIQQKLDIDPMVILNITKAAIEHLKDKEEVKIIINPVHTDNLYAFSEEFKNVIKGLKHIKIIEDRTVPKDGVIVESSDSRIDARLDFQIGEISKNMLAEASNHPSLADSYDEINIVINDPIDIKE